MTGFVLTKQHMAKSVLDALDAEKLGFHLPQEIRGRKGCRYDYGPEGYAGYHCGVGCSLPAEVHAKILQRNRNNVSVQVLVAAGIVECDPPTLEFAAWLQDIHDSLANEWSFEDESLGYCDEEEAVALLRQRCEEVLRLPQPVTA